MSDSADIPEELTQMQHDLAATDRDLERDPLSQELEDDDEA